MYNNTSEKSTIITKKSRDYLSQTEKGKKKEKSLKKVLTKGKGCDIICKLSSREDRQTVIENRTTRELSTKQEARSTEISTNP